MSLTARPAQLIQQRFGKIELIAEHAAAIFYAKLFEVDPSLRAMFKSDLHDQGNKVKAVLNIAVSSLNGQ